ncbi:MAG: tetratricopeptide repeat protein [Chloroflexota bacterium]|nr:tetratricopeptide repeat protein [Chloroflexota bacterium]
MPIRFDRRGAGRGLAALAVLGLLIGRGPALVTTAFANWAAVVAVAPCGDRSLPGHPSGAAGALPEPGATAWWQLAHARCAGDVAGTQTALQAVVQQSPARLDVLRALAPAAVAVAQQAADRYPDQAAAQLWLGDAQLVAGTPPAAIRAYERGLALQPHDANSWLLLGELYVARGDTVAAAHAYDQACRYVDHGKNGCPRAGDLHMQLHEYVQSAAAYQTADQQTGTAFHAQARAAALALLAEGHTAEAVPILQALAQAGDAEARRQLQQLGKPIQP